MCPALFVIPAVVFGDTLFICETNCLRCRDRSSKYKQGPEDRERGREKGWGEKDVQFSLPTFAPSKFTHIPLYLYCVELTSERWTVDVVPV